MKVKRIRKNLVVCISVIVFLLSYNNLSAAEYYVDFARGADTNNGTSTGTAFQHSPGDDNATNTAASTTLVAGDTVYFKGGVSYIASITDIDIDWSGSSGNPITYDGNSAGTWGTGRAIIDGKNVLNSRGFYATGTRSYITIDNFEIKEMGGYKVGSEPGGTCSSPNGTSVYGAGIDFTGGDATNIIVQNNYIHQMGNWLNQEPFEARSINGHGIAFEDASDITIDNNKIEKVKIAISLKATASNTITNITATNNDLSYFVWGFDIAPKGTNATMSNININNNAIHDYEEYDQANWAGCGEWPHTDGIFIRCDFDYSTYTGIDIHANEFYSTYSGGGGTAAIYLSTGASADIYNNTFSYTMKGRNIAVLYPPRANSNDQVVNIYGNTFQVWGEAINLRNNTAKRTVNIKNNIFYDPRTSGSGVLIFDEDGFSGPDSMDYNQYYSLNPSANIYRSGGWYDFSETQGLGFEANGAYGNPMFIDSSFGRGTLTNNNNFRLLSSSPAINSGSDLSIYFTNDKDGTPRAQNVLWDKGAYEWGGEASAPMPPSNLRVQ